MKKKVLFINPNRLTIYHGTQPHYGLGCLAAILKNKEHDVKILDYSGFPNLPDIEDFVKEQFMPDVIGISCYSNEWSYVKDIVKNLKKYNLPIVLGGPHTACYKDDLQNYDEVDCIVIGEAENVICDVIENIKRNGKTEIVYSSLPDVNSVPFQDLTAFVGYENTNRYILSTSRGCPFNCSFCCVKIINSIKWRSRKIDDLIKEIKIAVNKHKKLEDFIIADDIFSLNLKRAKEFIKRYIELGLKQKLQITSVRADSVDNEFIELLLQAGTTSMALGVESANEEVFKAIGKKETFEEIKQAIELFKRKKILFFVYMVIGLPHDNYERVKESIKFIRKVKPNLTNWNMMMPYKGTKAREWFDKHGKVYNEEQIINPDDIIVEPCLETLDFTLEERKKAYLKARLATCAYDWRHPMIVIRRIPEIIRYGLVWDLISGIIWGFGIRVRRVIRKQIIIYKLQKQFNNRIKGEG